MAVAPEAPRAVQRDQVAAPAEAGSSLLEEHDFYEEICNNTPLAKLFQATNLTTLVDQLCRNQLFSKENHWIEPKNISDFFESNEFKEALDDPASKLR